MIFPEHMEFRYYITPERKGRHKISTSKPT